MTHLRNRSTLAGGLLLLAAALLYLLTLDTGLRPEELVGGDLITHQYAQVQARPSNAPGYPLYTMGGWLWFHLGRRLVGHRLNPVQVLSLYSTGWGLASLLVLYLVLKRVSGQWPVALLLSAFYAVTYFFWYYSVTTEQYTSAVFQTLLLIWLAFKWEEQPRERYLLGLAFLCGTMLANMLTTLLVVPPLVGFILARRKGLRPRLVLSAGGLALLPLLSYAYVYIRGAQHPEWRGAGQWTGTGQWFIHFLTVQQGRDELAPGLGLASFFTADFPALMWQELTWPVFVGGLVGLAWLGRRRGAFLYSTLLLYLVFCWAYRFGNWFQVIIPAYPIFIIGLAALLGQVAPPRRRWLYALSLALLLGLTGSRLAASWLPPKSTNQRYRPTDTGLDPGWAILADEPLPPAVIGSTFEERVALEYLRVVWGAAPAVQPVDVESLPTWPRVEGQHYYVTRQGAAAAPQVVRGEGVYPQAAGLQLIGLPTGPQAGLPASAVSLGLDFGDGLQLAGWEPLTSAYPLPPQVAARLDRPPWQIALYWRATAPPAGDYTVSVRPLVGGVPLFSAGGDPLIQDHQPVWGTYPTGRWQPGHLVRDVYALPLPPEPRPEAVQVVVYRATGSGFTNLAEQTFPLPAAP